MTAVGSAGESAAARERTETAGHLAKGTLKTRDAIAISVSILAPGMAMQLNTGGVAAFAGGSTPFSFLLGGIACLTLAVVVIGFTRKMASAGYAYTYASRSLGHRTGFMAGWLYAFGMACFVPMTMAAVGELSAELLGLGGSWWFVFFLIGMALLLVLSVIRIAVTTRVQMLVGAATVAVLVIVDVIITAKGGAHGQTLAPFTPSHTATGGFNGVFYGIILGVTSYIGFETAADFGEETKNPRRAIPTAVIVSVLFAIVLYLWTTYSATIGYGIPALSKANNAWVAGGIAGVAQTYAGAVLAKLVTIGALLSAFVVCVGCATASTRTLFAMGRERVFPAWFGRTHPRYLTPMNASITVAVVATAVAAIVGLGFPSDAFGPAFTVYALLATIGTLAIILVYIALCLGGMVFLRRTSRRFNPLLHGVVPLIGVVIFVAAWYGSFRTATGVLEVAPYVAAAWFIVGIGVLAYLVRRRSEAVDRIGSILGEEGGESATGLDADAEPTA